MLLKAEKMKNTYVEPTYETIPTVMFRSKLSAIQKL